MKKCRLPLLALVTISFVLLAAAAKAEQAARQAADAARKAGSYFALWSFIALLSGAFSASYAATIGGRGRDRAVPAALARY